MLAQDMLSNINERLRTLVVAVGAVPRQRQDVSELLAEAVANLDLVTNLVRQAKELTNEV
jgi:hypothetical protein